MVELLGRPNGSVLCHQSPLSIYFLYLGFECGMARYGMVWYGMLFLGLIWYGMSTTPFSWIKTAQYGLALYGMVSMVRYDAVL